MNLQFGLLQSPETRFIMPALVEAVINLQAQTVAVCKDETRFI